MKICLHTYREITRKSIGGTERYLIDFSKELTILGYEPFIVCSSPEEHSIIEGIDVFGVIPEKYHQAYAKYNTANTKFFLNEVIQKPFSETGLKNLSNYVTEQLKAFDADIYHLNSFASALYIKPWGNFVVSNHENQLEYDSYWGNGFFEYMSELVRNKMTYLHQFDLFTVPSRYYAEEYSKQFNLNISGINLGVCLNHFVMQKNMPIEHSPANEKMIVLLPSRFKLYQKGHDIALKACSILKQQGVNVHMIFTGLRKDYQSNIPEFENLVQKYGISDCVTVTRYENILDAYYQCNIVISPERFCSYGLSISEALSLSRPTVLSNIPTYCEIASGFKHALFFENESAEDLARCILEAHKLSNSECREAAIKFREKYDLRECAKIFGKHYREIIQNRISD